MLTLWDVIAMAEAFRGAYDFDQPLTWDVSAVRTFTSAQLHARPTAPLVTGV